MTGMEPLLSVKAAATLAGVTTQYIRMLLAGGILERGDVEGIATVTRESLEAWMRLRAIKKDRLKRERDAHDA